MECKNCHKELEDDSKKFCGITCWQEWRVNPFEHFDYEKALGTKNPVILFAIIQRKFADTTLEWTKNPTQENMNKLATRAAEYENARIRFIAVHPERAKLELVPP